MSAAGETLGKKKHSDRDFKYLVAISYARDVEETAARLDRGLVELLGGDAGRVFFDQRSLDHRLPKAQVEPVLQSVFKNTFLFVRLWSPRYDHSPHTQLDKAAASPILLDEPDRAYAIRAAEGDPSPPIGFDAQLVGEHRQPLWRVAEEIVARLDQLLGDDFQRIRRRDRAFLKWDPPAYHAALAGRPEDVCAFDCHQAFAACCEAGELYCLVAHLAARLTSLAFEAQSAALANGTEAATLPTVRGNANVGLSRECRGLLGVFAVRYVHLHRMVTERDRVAKAGDPKVAQPSTDGTHGAPVNGMFCGQPKEDPRPQQAERLGDFLLRHMPALDATAKRFSAGVLRLAASEELTPFDWHETAIMLVCDSLAITNEIARFSADQRYLPRMEHDRDPRSAAAMYALQTTAKLGPLV